MNMSEPGRTEQEVFKRLKIPYAQDTINGQVSIGPHKSDAIARLAFLVDGLVAQLGERRNGIAEVSGSIPDESTTYGRQLQIGIYGDDRQRFIRLLNICEELRVDLIRLGYTNPLLEEMDAVLRKFKEGA